MAFFQEQKPHLLQAVGAGDWGLRLCFMTHEHKFFFKKRGFNQSGLGYWQGNEGGIQPIFEQIFDQGAGHRLARLQIDLWIRAGQGAGNRGQKIRRDGRNDAQP